MIWIAIISTLAAGPGNQYDDTRGYQTAFVETRSLRDCQRVTAAAVALRPAAGVVGQCVEVGQ